MKVVSIYYCRLKQKWYESGDKASKLLANQLKAWEAALQIGGIRGKNGNLVHNHKELNNVFKKFYEGLYRLEGQMAKNRLFAQLNLPKLSQENMRDLEHLITLNEQNKTIKLIPSGKTPVMHGIPSDFYKKFAEELSPEI